MTSEWEALVVGINRYPQMTTLHDLTVAAKDAEDIALHLRDYGYQPFRVQCLPQQPDQKGEARIHPTGMVTSAELQEALSNLLNPPPPNEPPDTALFYFSGHGWRQTVDGKDEVFLATSDVFPQIGEYGLSLSWLGEQLQQSRVKRVIVWLDCCLSGELMAFQPTNKAFCLITATRSYEPGLEIPHEQGLLTTALLDGLNPHNYPDGIVTSHLLKGFIETRMAQTSQRPLIKNSPQAILLTTSSPKKRFQNTCPYRSLSYFTQKPEDAAVFCGRSALTQQLIGRVKQGHRFVAVLGASGSGKSSLLRAGLLYQLKLGQDIPGSDNWIYLEPFAPQENPLKRLKQVIAKGNQEWVRSNEEQETGNAEEYDSRFQPTLAMSQGIDSLAGSPVSVQPVVMVIDQFEEAFTMCDEIQRQEFFDYLIQLNQQNPNLYLFIGMRSDFRSRLREYRPLMECINKPYINVEHLNRDEIAEAIVKPADWVGLGIEGELKERIINDVEDYPGSLPLLQYTLTELWNEAQQQGEQFLRLSTYTQLGGIEGTLEKRAEHVYKGLSAQEQRNVAKRLFLELTQVGNTYDTRRRVYLEDLANSHHSLAILKEVSDILASKDNRLITCEASQSEKTDASPTSNIQIDVVHEALIRHWRRLREWQDENREAMIVERDIETQAQQWQAEGKPKSMESLLTGAKLAKAEDYLSKYGDLGMLDGVAEEYINVSRQQDKTRRRRQRLTIGGVIGVVSLAAIVSTFFGLQSRRFGLESRRQATIASLREEAANIKLLLPLGTTTPLIQAIQLTGNNQTFVGTVLSEVHSSLYDAVEKVRERNSFSGHQDSVKAVAFSPDDTKIISGSLDKTLKLWDTSGKLLHTFRGHQDSVRAVAFSPDGTKIVSGSLDKTLKLWDISGKLLHTFSGHQDIVFAVAFSPDGKTILSGSLDKTLKLWDTSGKLLHTFSGHQDSVFAVAFSPDGAKIVSGSLDKTLKLWDTSGKLLHTLSGHEDTVFAVAFSPDGTKIVSGSHDNTLKLWDTSGKLLHTLSGHEDTVFAVAFSPDGTNIVSGSDDNTLKLWDTSGNLLHTFSGHQNYVRAVAFSPNGTKIVSGSDDNTLKLWDTSGKLLHTFSGHEDTIFAVAFSPDGTKIVSGSIDKTLKLWDTSGKLLHTLSGHEDSVFAVAFSPDGKIIVSGSDDNTLKLWDTSGKLLHTLSGHEDSVRAVAFSPDGTNIVSGSDDNTLKLWDTSGKLLHTFSGHEDTIFAVAFSPDGTKIVSGSIDKTLKLWDTSGKLLHTFSGHEDSVRAVAFSPDGTKIVSGSIDKTLKLWDTSGKLLHTLSGYEDSVRAVAFSPDGTNIVSGSDDNTLKLWDTSGKLLHTFSGHEDTIFAVAFSPDGTKIVSGSRDNMLKLWRAGNWQDLLQVGCERLRLHPRLASVDNDKAGGTCLEYGGWKETEQAEFLVRQGKVIAQEQQDVNTAIKKFKQAKRLDPDYQLTSLETEAKKLAAPGLVTQGETLLEEDKIKEALSHYQKAQQFDPDLQMSADSWNNLCWYGSLNRLAKEAMFACEKAVKLAPNDLNIRDSRGVTRALTGDKTGAIEDLQAYVNSPDISDENKAQRQGWIKELKAGKDPFTDEVLQDLRNTE